MGRVMVFDATFNNISVISWQSVLLVEKKEYPEKTTDLSKVTNKPDKWEICHLNTNIPKQ
jgi:hypothetical protein